MVKLGTVTTIILTRGFGFVRGDSDGKEIFFHVKDLVNRSDWESIKEGTRLSYIEVEDGEKGNKMRAKNIQKESV